MNHWIRYKWFWMTLLSWTSLGLAGALALISSPHSPSARIGSEFSVQLNGSLEKNQFLEWGEPLEPALESITRDWERKGWKCVSGKLNLAALLLNSGGELPKEISRMVQGRLFQKQGGTRLLGLLAGARAGQTYQWTSEILKDPLFCPEKIRLDFPLAPPAGAREVALFKSEKIRLLSWTMHPSSDFLKKFVSYSARRGFASQNLARQAEKNEIVFLLRRENALLLAIIIPGQEKYSISLMNLKKN